MSRPTPQSPVPGRVTVRISSSASCTSVLRLTSKTAAQVVLRAGSARRSWTDCGVSSIQCQTSTLRPSPSGSPGPSSRWSLMPRKIRDPSSLQRTPPRSLSTYPDGSPPAAEGLKWVTSGSSATATRTRVFSRCSIPSGVLPRRKARSSPASFQVSSEYVWRPEARIHWRSFRRSNSTTPFPT